VRHPSLAAKSIASKLRLYGAEIGFAVRATPGLRDRAVLIGHTLAFHWRNWRGQHATSARAQTQVRFKIGGYAAQVAFRPHEGDLSIFHEVFTREAYRVVDADLPPDSVKVVVDAGGNTGFTALYFAARYRHARIFVIEANPDNFAVLCANTAAEPRIVPVHACLVGVEAGPVFISRSGPAWGYQINRAGEGAPVASITVAGLMTEHGLTTIDLLKTDIEGAEKEVFAHGAFLQHVRVILAELHPGYDLADFNRDLAPAGLAANVSPLSGDPDVVLARRRPPGS
jgi:FkbM family methyltransferase